LNYFTYAYYENLRNRYQEIQTRILIRVHLKNQIGNY